MEWNMFIIPLTLIAVELVKLTDINKRWLPHVAVLIGAILGAVYAVVFADVSGVVYGASAAGIYDFAKSTIVDHEEHDEPAQ